MKLGLRRWIELFTVIGVVLVVDQITKRLVVDSLVLGQAIEPIPALRDFFQITRSHNTGASFGILPQASDLFLVVALVIVIGMIVFYPRIPMEARVRRLAMALVCGGALGNAIDRLEYGYVIDFIHYSIPGLISNVSNLADHAIVLGVLILFIESWLSERREKRQAAALSPDNPSLQEKPE